MKTIITSLAAAIVLAGCATPFTEFYQDKTGGNGVKSNPSFVYADVEPVITKGANPPDDWIAMYESGYAVVGESSFSAGNVDEAQAAIQAKAIGASHVLLYSKYRNTVSGAMPLITPNNTTSTSYVNGYSGGRAVSGTVQTTNYGTNTTYIPYSVDRSDYLAVYYAKARAGLLGVQLREPTGDERKAAGTNAGAYVIAVRRDSPAFRADIFKGDTILSVGDVVLDGGGPFTNLLAKYRGQTVAVRLIRDGVIMNKQLNLASQH